MKTFTAMVALLAAGVVQAQAADFGDSVKETLGIESPKSGRAPWNGLWIGVGGGYTTTGTDASVDWSGTEVLSLPLAGDGFSGRLEVGADKQFGRFVVGVSGGYELVDAKASASLLGIGAELDNGDRWFVQGRAGVTLTDFVLAYGLVRYNWADAPTASADGVGSVELNKREGFGYGGGIEAAVTERLKIAVEYVHSDFDKEQVASFGPIGINEETKDDTVWVRATYNLLPY